MLPDSNLASKSNAKYHMLAKHTNWQLKIWQNFK